MIGINIVSFCLKTIKYININTFDILTNILYYDRELKCAQSKIVTVILFCLYYNNETSPFIRTFTYDNT